MNAVSCALSDETAACARFETIPRRSVVLLTDGADVPGHDRATRLHLAAWVAALRGETFVGTRGFDACPAQAYIVPERTLLCAEAHALGIAGESALFGGVVPHAFLRSKVVAHPVVDEVAACPRGWNPALHRGLRDLVLPGYSAFCLRDALVAGGILLKSGAARLKLAEASGGRGQARVDSTEQLASLLLDLEDEVLERHGVVLERELVECETWSIGITRLGVVDLAYWGTQCQVRADDGQWVYGGSRLHVIRGGFEALLRAALPARAREAAELACGFDRAVRTAWPDMLLSRANYDVAFGRDAQGRFHRGVLEPSWRIGGATAAELAAAEVFLRRAEIERVTAQTHERHDDEAVPSGARVYYRAQPGEAGPKVKYVTVHADADLH